MKKTTTVILTATAGLASIGAMIMTRSIRKQTEKARQIMVEVEVEDNQEESTNEDEIEKEKEIEIVDDSDVEV